MENTLICCPQRSAALRIMLETYLSAKVSKECINNYLHNSEQHSILQILRHKTTPPQLQIVKNAYTLWVEMDIADRHAVLAQFYQKLMDLSITIPAKMITFLFCSIFVHELATLLAETVVPSI